MSRRFLGKLALCGVLLPILGLAGCQNLGRPTLLDSTAVKDQQGRALRFDPYPEVEAGPEVVGGRPPGYENAIAEPSRARWDQSVWQRRFGGQ